MVSVDIAILTILGIAALRGLFLGLIREMFSVFALVAACLSVRFFTHVISDGFFELSGVDWPELAVRIAVGCLIATTALFIVHKTGQMVQRGARAVGLGWADRMAGGLLGSAEGVLVAGLLLAVAVIVMGEDHPLLAESHSLAALERLEEVANTDSVSLPDVAAPPKKGH